ncbi:MAG: DUF2911 domain-containing protein [Gemmatimonadales bacterium]|jgi:hypothetical protein|nr:DUF2911 domain-containing protein [Gemmatimonadales bacterium]
MQRHAIPALAALALAGLAPAALAQSPPLVLPRESPAASVSQESGLTTVRVRYHRPAVNGRAVWGGLVPWNEVWRAGANENTVLEVSSPFVAGGRPLPAGRYGLHMIPGQGDWTVILSRQADAWGSFSYDPAEDAARFAVAPTEAEPTERLRYELDVVRDGGVAVTLRWERKAVTFPIALDVDRVVLDSLATQLRGIPRFFPDGWGNAAGWALAHGHLAEAGAWADSALGVRRAFDGLWTKAAVLERQGDARGAAAMRDEAIAGATEAQVNAAGYWMLQRGRTDEAIVLFRRNVRDYPKSWNVHDSLAEALGVKGDRKAAIASYRTAASLTTDPAQQRRIAQAIAALQ